MAPVLSVLVDFQDKLKHGESLFWSWTQGGGVNYFSLMSYYLAGPMNFLCVFIPSQWLREFLMFSVCAKVAFAGCFTAIFLRSVFKKNDFSLVVFGTTFSFCAFFMGYYWNTIWLDTVCITPLVALGIVKLLTEGKFRLFTITLAVSLLSNYYIGLFTCIFVLLIFIAYSIVKWDGFKSFLQSLQNRTFLITCNRYDGILPVACVLCPAKHPRNLEYIPVYIRN